MIRPPVVLLTPESEAGNLLLHPWI